MKSFLKWTGIAIAAAGVTVLVGRSVGQLRRRVDRGLANAEAVAAEARQSAEKTADALAHTEEAMHAARRFT